MTSLNEKTLVPISLIIVLLSGSFFVGSRWREIDQQGAAIAAMKDQRKEDMSVLNEKLDNLAASVSKADGSIQMLIHMITEKVEVKRRVP